ncbi:CHASE2 domain-containing protein [Methylocapsa palsarum]|uniref:Adenylate cyclase n=1 Tax=Methylocapsa palsarum TaxID=1612308 RepID=A0A1I4A170_9HYPH|nr:adenylate/guanylate cyclase domain-containing protein [Methylocapsa palsarum]SFK50068.1 adenylate cyclase [Methylocapsa palsarum]
MQRLKTRISRSFVLVVLCFLALAVVLRAADPLFVQALRFIAFDSYQRLAPQAYDPDLPVRIVDIDPASIARLGQWPWPRTAMRDLVMRLTEKNAAAIVFDILFGEKDRTSLDEIVKRLPADKAARISGLIDGQTNDEAFAEALKAAPGVLSIILTNDKSVAPLEMKAGIVFAGDDPKPFLHAFPGAEGNLPLFNSAARGLGSMNLVRNHDAVVRQAPLFFRLGDKIAPSLAAEALRVAQGASTYVLKSSNASGETAFGQSTGLNHVRIGALEIATDSASAVWLKFRHSNPAAFIPAWKVIAGEIDESEIAGKIVFVGASTPGLLDLRATPLDAALPGVEIQAQIVEHILAGRALTRPDYAVALEQLLVVAFGLLVAGAMPRLAPASAAALGAFLPLVIIAGGWISYRYWDLLFDPVYPSLALLLLTGGITFYIYRRVEIQRGEIRSAFGRYLAPEVVEDIIAGPEKLTLGGEMRQLTLMFCDVRNFTAISESLTASELTTFINELLTPLSDIILRERGTIDKYMGDAIMAFWNAPLDVSGHAERACRCALEMTDKMSDLNEMWRVRAVAAGQPFDDIRIGIGVNTGECCVGNLGSEQRFDYSAIGDEVNVTSRLEVLTKLYGLPAVISEATVKGSPNIEFLELDLVKVVGRTTPTRLYTPAGVLDCAPAQFARLRPLHDSFLRLYREQSWDDATDALAQCRGVCIRRLDTYYSLFAARIENLSNASPGPSWSGAYTMTEK